MLMRQADEVHPLHSSECLPIVNLRVKALNKINVDQFLQKWTELPQYEVVANDSIDFPSPSRYTAPCQALRGS